MTEASKNTNDDTGGGYLTRPTIQIMEEQNMFKI